MRTFSYTICHYGRDYLSYSLRSVSPLVEKSYIFYTSHPSHGHATDIVPPESREEIMASIPEPEWGKLIWVDTEGFWTEGPQRDYAVKTLINEGAEIIINLDYDEVHSTEVLDKMLKEVWDRNIARNHLVNMLHFWRSFNWVCTDDGWPVRIIDTRRTGGVNYLSTELGRVNHMGYAITDKILRYKLSCHGHKDELRENWYKECWEPWPPPENVHPTNGRKSNGEGWWNPKPYDKNLLPVVLHSHPYFNLERIE